MAALKGVIYGFYVNHGSYIQQKPLVFQDLMRHFFFDRIPPTATVHYQMAKALLKSA